MRIKTQFLISITVFSVILVIIGSSVTLTQLQITQLNNQEATARDIQTGASNLNYISNNYFLYQYDSSIDLWQTEFSALSAELAQLNSTNTQQQTLVSTVNDDLVNLNSVFSGVITFLNNAPRNESIRILPSFQTEWNRMSVQIQGLSFDSQQLSQGIKNQSDQAIFTNTISTIALLVSFAAFFIIIYLLNFRRTLKSISELKTGINVIGSGNLEHVVQAGSKDEIADISKSVNQMSANLKAITSSKTDLEKEIEERKKAEEALAKSERRWATTLSSIGDSVIATDLNGNITFMNNVAEDLTGWSLGEAFQKPLQQVFHIINEDTRREVENPVEKVLKKGTVIGLANHSILVSKDGHEIPIDDSGSPIKDQNGQVNGVVLVFHDITERKQTERELDLHRKNLEKLVEERTKQLKDTERLAAIGATAGMVGHDIRNPLQAITSDLYLAKTDLAATSESEEKKNITESLEEIEKNIFYVNKIVADLQDFARPLAPKLEEADFEQIIHSALGHLVIPGNVTVKHSVRKDFPKLKTDPAYMQRILTNLANNAIQAMPNGGKLTINAANKNGKAVITVEDNGEGIPESVRSKLFTPLVTTKSKGQGFGLSVVKRFTEALGGSVTFESEVGKGTKFIIELPIDN